MMDRYDTYLSEQYRRNEELVYAVSHNTAKENGLQVSYYRKLACRTLIHTGEYLVSVGKKLQPSMEGANRPLIARMK